MFSVFRTTIVESCRALGFACLILASAASSFLRTSSYIREGKQGHSDTRQRKSSFPWNILPVVFGYCWCDLKFVSTSIPRSPHTLSCLCFCVSVSLSVCVRERKRDALLVSPALFQLPSAVFFWLLSRWETPTAARVATLNGVLEEAGASSLHVHPGLA